MEAKPSILIIDSAPSVLSRLGERIKHLGFNLWHTAAPDIPINQLASLSPELAILGPSLDTETSLKCIHKLIIVDPVIPILTSCDDVCLSASAGSGTAPFEGIHCLSVDPDPDEISSAIENALRRKAELKLQPDFQLFIGQGPESVAIRQKIRNTADKDVTILITGETGTGKELIARSIHYHSLRSKGPLVKINCGALPDELLESEVFGFQRGAFTDAHKDKPGHLEMANGGTLFIDEIGNLSLSLQVKFLQVLEEKSFSRLGGTEDKIIDIRVVAATNVDLQEKVREGTFRKDLFYRLNVINIHAPPLRERKDDSSLLIHYFLNKYSLEFKKEVLDIPDNVANLFLEYQWPGNVRELENVIRLATVLRDWSFTFKELHLENLKYERVYRSSLGASSPNDEWQDDKIKMFFSDRDFSLKKISQAYVSEAERQTILKALKKTRWNRKKAAQQLCVSYKTLLNRIVEFDLKP
jgi:two-component system response regulator AtoC